MGVPIIETNASRYAATNYVCSSIAKHDLLHRCHAPRYTKRRHLAKLSTPAIWQTSSVVKRYHPSLRYVSSETFTDNKFGKLSCVRSGASCSASLSSP